MRTIMSPAGIGDNIWLLMKLINAKEKFKFQITASPPQRTKPLFDLVPNIAESCEYVNGLAYDTIKKYNVCRASFATQVKWKSVKDDRFFLSANQHLEMGRRIETFLPDLKTDYRLSYQTRVSDQVTLTDDLRITDKLGSPLIGIFGSSYSTTRAWAFWSEKEWFQLIHKIHAERPEVVFAVIGASFDFDLGYKLIELLDIHKVPYFNTLGKNLSYVVELLKILDYFIGFPSGLSIMNETLGKDTLMFYPQHLDKMRYAWMEPGRQKTGAYTAPLFCDVDKAYSLICNQYCLFDKI